MIFCDHQSLTDISQDWCFSSVCCFKLVTDVADFWTCFSHLAGKFDSKVTFFALAMAALPLHFGLLPLKKFHALQPQIFWKNLRCSQKLQNAGHVCIFFPAEITQCAGDCWNEGLKGWSWLNTQWITVSKQQWQNQTFSLAPMGELSHYVTIKSCGFDCAQWLQEELFVVHMSCCAVRCQNHKTVQKDLKFYTVLLFMLMEDVFGWKRSKEVFGMFTKLKMSHFAVLILCQVS